MTKSVERKESILYPATSTINLGEEYPTVLAFKDALKTYEETNYMSTHIKDSTTIERAKKRGVKIPMKESLKYYSVTYRCCRGETFY